MPKPEASPQKAKVEEVSSSPDESQVFEKAPEVDGKPEKAESVTKDET